MEKKILNCLSVHIFVFFSFVCFWLNLWLFFSKMTKISPIWLQKRLSKSLEEQWLLLGLRRKYVVANHEMRVLLKEPLSSLSSQVVILRVLLKEPLSSLSSEVIPMTMKINGNPMDLYFSKILNYLRIYFFSEKGVVLWIMQISQMINLQKQ